MSVPIPDLMRTDLLVLMGANPVVSHGSFLTAPRIKDRMQDVVKRGGRVVVVDPRRSETAAAFEWLGIVPDGDAYFLLSLLQVLFAEGLVDRQAVAAQADGLDWLAVQCAPFTPEDTERHTGIEPAVVRASGARLGADPAGCGVRAARDVRWAQRHADHLSDRRRQPRCRQPGQARRQCVRHARNRRAAVGDEGDGGVAAADLSPQAHPHRGFSGRDRCRAGRDDGQGDVHAGQAADQGVLRQRGQSGALGAQRSGAGSGARERRPRGRARSVRQRDDRTLRLRAASHHDVRARRLRADLSAVPGHPVPAGHRGGRRAARRGAHRMGHHRRPDAANGAAHTGIRGAGRCATAARRVRASARIRGDWPTG